VEKQVKRRQKVKEEAQVAAKKRKEQALADEQARVRRAEEEAREQGAEQIVRLAEAWSALSSDERASIDRRILARVKEELPFVYAMYERERSAGKGEADMSITVRSTLMGYRNDLLKARLSAVKV